MASFAGTLNENAKVMVLQTATLLSAVDGDIHDTEIDLIRDVAHALAVPRSYVTGIMSDALGQFTESDSRLQLGDK